MRKNSTGALFAGFCVFSAAVSCPGLPQSAAAESGKSARSAATKRLLPQVLSISGEGSPVWIWAGEEKAATPGQRFPFGTVVKTGPRNSAQLLFPDDSVVAVHADSALAVEEWTGRMQATALQSGQVRAMIVPTKIRKGDPVKLKFLIRTKTAVLGVRGTEFVMDYDPASAAVRVHTIKGVVDVAKSEAALVEGKGSAVKASRFLEISAVQGLSVPAAFDPAEFASQLNPTAPREKFELTQFAPAAAPSADETAAISGDRTMAPQGKAGRDERTIQLRRFQTSVLIGGMRGGVASWNPSIPIPRARAISIRGHFGIGTGSNAAGGYFGLLHEERISLRLSLLGTPLHGEAGYGFENSGFVLAEHGSVFKMGVSLPVSLWGVHFDEVFAGYSNRSAFLGFALNF